jgi:hypothetical protein
MRSKLHSLLVAGAFTLPLVGGVAFAQTNSPAAAPTGSATTTQAAPSIATPPATSAPAAKAMTSEKKADPTKTHEGQVAKRHGKAVKDQQSKVDGAAAAKTQTAKVPETAKKAEPTTEPAKKL